MAQLIKLKDYISRYEWNTYRYPSQFMRLKQDNWNKLYSKWSNPQSDVEIRGEEQEEQPVSRYKKWRNRIKKVTPRESTLEHIKEEEDLPETQNELKQYFLDKLYPFQLKWASSTVTDVSLIDESFYTNETLKYFLQRFPDIYFLMYYPIFSIKNAPIDGEIILISPVGIEIIYLLEEDKNKSIITSDERTWILQDNESETTFLSPMIALNRTEKIVKSILSKGDVEYPIKKMILSRTNFIIPQSEPYQTKLIGKKEYPNWFKEKRDLTAPLKSQQLKATEILLKYCQTTALKRPEWDSDGETDTFMVESE